MSLNDPFFDAWVRDKLRHAETRRPDHLWDAIRKGGQFYVVADRNKYFLILLVLLLTTGGIAYWGFHPREVLTARTSPVQAAGGEGGTAATGERGTMAAADANGDAANGGPVAAAGAESDASVAAAKGVPASGTGLATPESTTSGLPESSPEGAIADASAPAGAPRTAFPGPTLTTGPTLATSPTLAPEGAQAPPQWTEVPGGADLASPPAASTTGEASPTSLTTQVTQVTQVTRVTPASAISPPVLHLRERRHTYLEVYAGPDHVTHYITASNPAYADFVRQARSTEMSYPSFSLGMRLDLPLWTDRWRLQTGIHYSQINEQLHYFNPSATHTEYQITQRSVVQSSGAVVQVRDTTSFTVKGAYLKQSLNAYRRIDIPLVLSYTLVHGRQFEMGGSAGAFVNLVSWYNGDILDISNLPAAIHSGHDQGVATWKRQMGASLYGSLALKNQLSSRFRVSLEPYLRYELGSVNKDVNVYKERFVTTGLSLGLQYAIGK